MIILLPYFTPKPTILCYCPNLVREPLVCCFKFTKFCPDFYHSFSMPYVCRRRENKEKIKKAFLKQTRKLLETKLSSRNLIKGISTWAVPLLRYTGPFLKWMRKEHQHLDQKTRLQYNASLLSSHVNFLCCGLWCVWSIC